MTSSEYAAYYASALQAEGEARTLKTLATCKHTYGYDMEASDGVTRTSFDAKISLRDEMEYFLPPFRACIERARVRSIMCAYIEVNGVPSCANGAFQNGIARETWGFAGAVVSDCDAVATVGSFKYANGSGAIMRAVFEGGLDINCGATVATYAAAAVADGNITLEILRTSVIRTMTMWFETGFMDPPALNPYGTLGPNDVDTPAHRALAQQVAQQGATLLRNVPFHASPNGAGSPILPLPASVKRIAVVGPHANSTQALLGNYSPHNTVVDSQSVLQALQRRAASSGAFTVTTSPGCAGVACPDQSGFPAALAVAADADVVIAVMGLCSVGCPGGSADDAFVEGEGHDRVSLSLPGQQEPFLAALLALSPSVPVVVLLVHGGPLAIEWAAANMPSILTMYYPGEMGGDAAAALLFGDVSPSGRTLVTWYPAAFAALRNVTDLALAPHTGPDGRDIPGVTYLWYGGDVVFPFGLGLSYTNFSFVWASAADSARSIDARAFGSRFIPPPSYAVNVTNTGRVTSDVSVLAFMSSGQAGEPISELFDFARAAALEPGQSVTLTFSVTPTVAASAGTLAPGVFRIEIGDRAVGNTVVGSLEIVGDAFTMRKK